jgi:hypothetical protein
MTAREILEYEVTSGILLTHFKNRDINKEERKSNP